MWSLLVQLKWKLKTFKICISILIWNIRIDDFHRDYRNIFKVKMQRHNSLREFIRDQLKFIIEFSAAHSIDIQSRQSLIGKKSSLSLDRLCNFQTINQFYSCVMLPLSPVASHTNSNSKLIMSCSINVFGKSLVTHISLWGVGRRDALYTMWDIRRMTMFTRLGTVIDNYAWGVSVRWQTVAMRHALQNIDYYLIKLRCGNSHTVKTLINIRIFMR